MGVVGRARAREAVRPPAGHPLVGALPLLRDTLVPLADEARNGMVVTDAQGRVLWREGTARAADQVVAIHPTEHLTHHSWTCAASPIHDPETGALVGAVDVTGPAPTFHPATLALVVAAARLAEGFLRTQLAVRDERLLSRNLAHLIGLRGEPGALLSPRGRVLAAQPPGLLPPRIELPAVGDRVLLGEGREGRVEPLAEGWLLRLSPERAWCRPALAMAFLGAGGPVTFIDGRRTRLTLRHAELLTVLALHPEGRTADELATALHGDAGKAVTVRAEMHRLRVAVGAEVLRTQPYRLSAQVDADFVAIRTALAEGRVRDAARLYRGELLPRSEAPRVREEREVLAAVIRRAVLGSGDAEALWSLADRPDIPVDHTLLDGLRRTLPVDDPRRAMVDALRSS